MAAPYSTGMSMTFSDRGQFPITQSGISTPILGLALAGATGQMAISGQVWWPEMTGSKTITRVQFLWDSSLVKSHGTGLTVSLQDVSATTAAIQPDGTPDQTVAIANGDANFIASQWYRTGALSAGRVVNYGDWVSFVLGVDGGGLQALDGIRISYLRNEDNEFIAFESSNVNSGAGWGAGANRGGWNIVFEFSDGTFGRFARSGFIFSAMAAYTYNSGSAAADEVALEFAFTEDKYIEGAEFILQPGAGDVSVVLYRGTTIVASTTLSTRHMIVQAVTPWSLAICLFSSAVQIVANTVYRLAIKPLTADTMGIWYFNVNEEAHMDLHTGGRVWCWSTRVDGGDWSAPLRTRRPFIWPILAGW